MTRLSPAKRLLKGSLIYKDKTTSVLYNPPASAPSPYITPNAFLPKERQDQTAPTSPPATTKSYHLNLQQIEKMKKLRLQNPNKWTRGALAKKFQCSSLFVGMCAPAPAQRLRKVNEQLERQKRTWTRHKLIVRDDRRRRREQWGRDEI